MSQVGLYADGELVALVVLARPEPGETDEQVEGRCRLDLEWLRRVRAICEAARGES